MSEEVERRVGSRKGRVRKWRSDREEEDRVAEMTLIEKDVVYYVLLLNKRIICK